MKMDAFICYDQSIGSLFRPLHLLLGIASRVGAPVITPVIKILWEDTYNDLILVMAVKN